MTKKVFNLIVLFFLLVTFSSCGSSGSVQPVETESYDIMGTIIIQKVYGKNAGKAADEAVKELKKIEGMMTINAPGGDINRLNESAGNGTWNTIDEKTMYVLKKAKEFSQLSGGAFDVTVGPLVKAWGINTENERIPSKDEVDNLLKLVDYDDILINGKSARLARSRQIADLGGIAKGYAGDAVIEVYKSYGIESALVSLGGNVVALGNKPDGTQWKVGVRNPRSDEGQYIGILNVTGKAVVSSGDYERFFERNGVRYHHILDPKTGYPADSGLIGTTIVADLSVDADALSTATFVLGLEKGLKLIESIKGVEAVFVTKDKKVYTTKGLKDSFIFDDESGEYEYVKKG